MHIKAGFADAGWHDLKESAAYEWWYLDAISSDGRTAVVFIWFAGLPFSPDALTNHERGRSSRALDHVAMFTAVYVDGKQIAYALNRHDKSTFEAERDALRVRVGPNVLEPSSGNGFTARIDAPMLFGGGRLVGEFELLPVVTADGVFPEGGTELDHLWNPLAPACSVSGSLRLTGRDGSEGWSTAFEGVGYLDHNYGRRPLTEGIRRWSWGRAHLGDTTLVFYQNEPMDGLVEAVLGVVDSGENVPCSDVRFTTSEWRRRILCPRFPDVMRVEGMREGAPVRMEARRRHIVDWGPFYMRFLSDVTANVGGRELSGFGITEYLDPRGLRARWLRPLIKTRIRLV